MSQDDAEHDDDGLKSLRAVWLSMPDEDPPERGLADLMAAARVKANEMAEAGQPSWWERFLAIVRRPQVLALATILLLIGGGVIISQRREKLEAQPTPVTATPESISQGSAAAGADGTGAAQDEAKAEAKDTATAEPTVAAPAAEQAIEAPPLPRERDLRAKGAAATSPVSKPAPAKKQAAPKRKMPSKSDSGLVGGALSADKDTLMTEDSEAPVETTAAPKEAKTPAQPTVKQLHTQARDAAARNDCDAVRLLAKKIARQDAPYYRANIATDQALATCLN